MANKLPEKTQQFIDSFAKPEVAAANAAAAASQAAIRDLMAKGLTLDEATRRHAIESRVAAAQRPAQQQQPQGGVLQSLLGALGFGSQPTQPQNVPQAMQQQQLPQNLNLLQALSQGQRR